jgi:hypothetical protein
MNDEHLEYDESLGPWCMAAADAIEQEIARWAPVPDLADVLARARAEHPEAVPASWTGNEELDDIVPISRRRALTRELPDAGLAMFATALRGRVEDDLHERGLAEIPVPIKPRQRQRLRTRTIATAVLALAAVVIATVIGVPRVLMERDHGDTTASAARTLQRATAPGSWRVAPNPTLEPIPVVTPVPSEPAVAPEVVPETPSRTSTTAAERLALLDALEREADARWRSGDLVAAERLLRKVIARTGKSSRAELAYGDLFALSRQLRGGDGPVAVWREYLRKFPRGRFSEDARAGLCRHAGDAEQTRACWSNYLRLHPGGSHASEARRWTATKPNP